MIRMAGYALTLTLLTVAMASAQSAGTAEDNLKRRSITLPVPSTPSGNYVPAVRVGNLLFLSSTGPVQSKVRGKVGKDVSPEEAYQAARDTGLNALAVIRRELESLDRVRRVVRVAGLVNVAPGFTELPAVINGFSDLMVDVFGEAIGKHARSAVGVAELPNNYPVAIEVTLEVDGSPVGGLSPSDIAAIRATSERWTAAVREGRWDDATATFTPDAILRFPDAVFEGRAAIRKFFDTMPRWNPTRVLHIDEIQGRGDMAFVAGHSTVTPEGGGPPVIVGRYLDIRLRQPDGTWLFYRDTVTPVPARAPVR